ncbi:MAG: hypothetical protein AAFN48_09170 [Pseudomonadota bacterium]
MSWLSDLMPVPLAAPETPELRRARYRTVGSCLLVAALVLFFGSLRSAIGLLALPLVVGAATFALVQGWLWLKAKNAADDAWLLREKDDVA